MKIPELFSSGVTKDGLRVDCLIEPGDLEKTPTNAEPEPLKPPTKVMDPETQSEKRGDNLQHPENGLFAAIAASLSHNTMNEEEYLAADLARDPVFLHNKPQSHGPGSEPHVGHALLASDLDEFDRSAAGPAEKMTRRQARAAANLKYCLEKHAKQAPFRGWFSK